MAALLNCQCVLFLFLNVWALSGILWVTIWKAGQHYHLKNGRREHSNDDGKGRPYGAKLQEFPEAENKNAEQKAYRCCYSRFYVLCSHGLTSPPSVIILSFGGIFCSVREYNFFDKYGAVYKTSHEKMNF